MIFCNQIYEELVFKFPENIDCPVIHFDIMASNIFKISKHAIFSFTWIIWPKAIYKRQCSVKILYKNIDYCRLNINHISADIYLQAKMTTK
jgi:hypothetical protein